MLDRDRVKELCLPFLRQYLESRGVKIKASGQLFCPFHKNTNTPAAFLYEKDAHPHVHCFSEGKTFDIFDAVAFFENLTDFKEILASAARFCGVDTNSVGAQNRRRNAPAKNSDPDAWKMGFTRRGNMPSPQSKINSIGAQNHRRNAPAKNSDPDAWKKGFILRGNSTATSIGGAFPKNQSPLPAKQSGGTLGAGNAAQTPTIAQRGNFFEKAGNSTPEPQNCQQGAQIANSGDPANLPATMPDFCEKSPAKQSGGTLGAGNAAQTPTNAQHGVFLEKAGNLPTDFQNRPQSADNAPQSEPAQEPAQNSEWGTVKLGQPRPVDFDVTGLGDEFHF